MFESCGYRASIHAKLWSDLWLDCMCHEVEYHSFLNTVAPVLWWVLLTWLWVICSRPSVFSHTLQLNLLRFASGCKWVQWTMFLQVDAHCLTGQVGYLVDWKDSAGYLVDRRSVRINTLGCEPLGCGHLRKVCLIHARQIITNKYCSY